MKKKNIKKMFLLLTFYFLCRRKIHDSAIQIQLEDSKNFDFQMKYLIQQISGFYLFILLILNGNQNVNFRKIP